MNCLMLQGSAFEKATVRESCLFELNNLDAVYKINYWERGRKEKNVQKGNIVHGHIKENGQFRVNTTRCL